MAAPQLKLVTEQAPGFDFDTTDPVRRVFEHWLYMLGRSPRRCKMGPTRRAAINAALAMGYELDMLLQTVEGIAADPLDGARDDHMRDAMREIEWVLKSEARIERWAEVGERLRVRAERELTQRAEAAECQAPRLQPEQVAADRQRLKDLAQRLRASAR